MVTARNGVNNYTNERQMLYLMKNMCHEYRLEHSHTIPWSTKQYRNYNYRHILRVGWDNYTCACAVRWGKGKKRKRQKQTNEFCQCTPVRILQTSLCQIQRLQHWELQGKNKIIIGKMRNKMPPSTIEQKKHMKQKKVDKCATWTLNR